MLKMWTPGDIVIVIDDSLTDDPVLTAEIDTPAGRLKMMAEVSIRDGLLSLRGLHLHGVGVAPNAFGLGSIRRLADAVMKEFGCDEIVVEGAVRTSGANPGNAPGFRFIKRRLRP
jgi:hypothetical protein